MNLLQVKIIINFLIHIFHNNRKSKPLSDAILSVPGSGRHIERITEFLSRLQQCNLNIAQMKKITQYMLHMVDAIEQQKRISE